ncbi:hypothetical protein F511_11499 [Dorcoceras hygrometricum]|uniref:Uncharacterized protein n=1 Tax=Dorcoceras hygrometricum TaxID=472368 RepID=A0A2Z7CXU9_9LAMI|nr:hypothetical protein F511_11499 [Dorcoceras hygrometricum]
MVTEADLGKGTVTHTLSSIALLQERFRQLEKMKELRQERELLKILSESEKSCSPLVKHHDARSKTSCVLSELVFLPPNPQCQLSLSLWPDPQMKKADSCRGIEAPTKSIAKSWFNDAPLVCSSDVDTSLRL